MTAEQLEELLGKVTQGEWKRYGSSVKANGSCDTVSCSVLIGLAHVHDTEQYDDEGRCFMLSGSRDENATLIALAPSLARRVIAAEKLVEALDWCIEVLQNNNHDLTALQAIKALHAYREASK